MIIKLDFICASLEKTDHIIDFLKNFKNSTKHEKFKINLILVDQNPISRETIFKNYYPEIIYTHSRTKGLSLNRNIGLEKSFSKYYSFIDSDCSIDENYFNYLHETIIRHDIYQDIVIFGKIQSLEDKIDLFKKWPKNKKELTKLDSWKLSTSVNIVYKCKKIRFDEKLGIGAKFGSCEDIDYSLRVNGKKIYDPNLIIYHPHQSFHESNNEKIYSYGLGFGALCKKNISFFSICFFTAGIVKKIIDPFLGRAKLYQSYISIKGRIHGFISYEKN